MADPIREAIHAWIREDVPLAGKMNLMPKHVEALITKLAALRAPQGDGAEAMREALESLVESLRPAEHVPFVDPVHGAAVEALGRRIGFGALMSSASASWAKVAAERGDPAGGEFVSGPCRAVLQSDLRRARAALDQHSLTKNGGADHGR